jgi:hypothetical protein
MCKHGLGDQVSMVEAGGVGKFKRVENTELIENYRRTTRRNLSIRA